MPAVALRKESVDRNHSIGNIPLHIVGSLSARRAWIEINVGFPIAAFLLMVALRKESVDRNLPGLLTTDIIKLSLSARRAWIEISSQ